MSESDALEVLKKPTEHIRAEDDDCMWIDKKLPSNKAEQYAKAMATAQSVRDELVEKIKTLLYGKR